MLGVETGPALISNFIAKEDYLPSNKPRGQLAQDSMFRHQIDVITIVQSYNGILMMVLEIIGGHFLPPPGQWSDPKSPGTIGLSNFFFSM